MNNPVKKYSDRFNKPQRHRDKKHDYRRKEKHHKPLDR